MFFKVFTILEDYAHIVSLTTACYKKNNSQEGTVVSLHILSVNFVDMSAVLRRFPSSFFPNWHVLRLLFKYISKTTTKCSLYLKNVPFHNNTLQFKTTAKHEHL